jgi:hypothetical protein
MTRSPLEIREHLLDLSGKASALERRITESLSRSDKTVALSNFCSYISGELKNMSGFYPANTAGLAWSTRNLFEVNLTIRHVLLSNDNFLDWLGQALHDEKDFIDGVLSTSRESQNADAKNFLKARLKQLHGMAQRHELEFSKPFRVQDIAKGLGMLDEYAETYRLFSKYVHPSSLLVNAWHRQTAEKTWNDIFLVKAQTYAGDSIHRVMEACGFTPSAA